MKGAGETKTVGLTEANIIFPHQLFNKSPLIENGFPVYLMEEFLFFRQYPFHQQKIAFHRASMKAYQSELASRGIEIKYIESHSETSDVRNLLATLDKEGVKSIHIIDPVDDWLGKRILKKCNEYNIKLYQYSSPMFLNSEGDLEQFFKEGKKRFFHHDFYTRQRKRLDILVDGAGNPVGGKWSFDADNRKKYPRGKNPPQASFPDINEFSTEAKEYVNKYFLQNPGEVDMMYYPIDHRSTLDWLKQFLQERFREFGPYEDAIVANESILHHSVITPMLNVGLITPKEVVDRTLAFAEKQKIPLNTLEGFIRQIIGWREFMRGLYIFKGAEERTKNYWGFNRKIPGSFYDGTTGIDPIDITIRKVLRTGYCHHIERLMVLGNFMLLCEFDPDEVYRWFMELFIDAYDWVMVPNVYGMSQFADGGLMATKPYISGSNYLKKMSDYKKGAWQEVWDGLFWRFMHVHRDFFTSNPRLGMLVRTFDKMATEKQSRLIETAELFLEKLDE